MARTLNTRGMRLYKGKQYGRAAAAFELAHANDPSYPLPIYNRACVAGLQRDSTIHRILAISDERAGLT